MSIIDRHILARFLSNYLILFGLLFNHLFARQVGACADTLARRPVGSFFVGLLAMILAGPALMIVSVTVIGLPFAYWHTA